MCFLAPYAVITFPFLFAMMFGDACHGFLMTLFAIWLITYEDNFMLRKSKNEVGRCFLFLTRAFLVPYFRTHNNCFVIVRVIVIVIVHSSMNAQMWEMIFGGRYIILLMGLFSVYCGTLYNEFFSKAVALFPSTWDTSRYQYLDGPLLWTIIINTYIICIILSFMISELVANS